MTQRTNLLGTAAALLLALGCDIHIDVSESGDEAGDDGGDEDGGDEDGGDADGGDEDGGDADGGDEDGGDEGGDDEGGEAGDEGGEDDGGDTDGGDDGGDDAGDDGGGGGECSTYDQNCDVGEVCNGWANDGGNEFNATRCSPLEADPGQPGDVCTVEGNQVSGIDSCDITGQCLQVDPETNIGVCVELCQGTPDAPICDNPDTTCQDYLGNLPACLPSP